MFEKIETEYLIIETESDNLFEDVIETMPITPVYLKISALAYGIPLCGRSIEDIGTYLRQCNSNRVLPFSKTEWTFNDSKKIFLSGDIGFDNYRNYLPDNANSIYKRIAKNIRDGSLKGRKPHRFTIELGAPINTGFKALQKEIKNVLSKNYQIYHGELWLTTWVSSRSYDDGYRPISTMMLSKEDSNNKLELSLKGNDDDLQREKLMEWFYALESNYDTESKR